MRLYCLSFFDLSASKQQFGPALTSTKHIKFLSRRGKELIELLTQYQQNEI